ncbi:hypothetical protein HQ496_08215 [bacterium]|nr:hypothetical protein [bacterium]
MKVSSDKKELRSFGFILFGALLILNTYFWWKGEYQLWISIVGTSLALIAATFPLILGPFHWLWMKVGLFLGFIMTTVILTVTYVVMVTPIGVILRILKKDILHLKLDPKASSYWITPDKTDPQMGAERPY